MKQTLQSILTASDAVLFPAISRNHSLNSVLCITESDVFRCNDEIAVFLQDPDFQNCLCKQDFVDVLFVLKGNCTCKFYKTDLTTPPESVFLSKHSRETSTATLNLFLYRIFWISKYFSICSSS